MKKNIFLFLTLVFILQSSVAKAFTDGQNAFNVIGQSSGNPFLPFDPLFTTDTESGAQKNEALVGGTGSVVVDTVNHRLFTLRSTGGGTRILVFDLDASNELLDHIPDAVLGQENFYNAVIETPGASTAAGNDNARNLAFDSDRGYLFAGDIDLDRIVVYDVNTITNGEDAVYVLCQPDFTNLAAGVTAGLCYNNGDGMDYDEDNQRLFMADNTNNRVLVFDMATISNGEDAVNVLGQTDFVTATSGTTDSTFSGPSDVEFDSENSLLYVTDGNNNRILIFDLSNGLTNGEAAINVLGQTDFVSSGTALTASQGGFDGITLNEADDLLFVTDGDNNRILVFDVATLTNGEDAVNVLGAVDFVSAGLASGANGFSGVNPTFDPLSEKLWTFEGGSLRIMAFDTSDGITNGEDAVDGLGQYSDYVGDDYVVDLTIEGNMAPSFGFDEPEKMAIDTIGHRAFITDSGNSRVVIYDLETDNTFGDFKIDAVLGQTDIYTTTDTGSLINDINFDDYEDSSNGFRVAFDPTGNRLFVADGLNNRVLVFDVASVTNGEAAINVLGQPDFVSNTEDNGGISASTLDSPRELLYDDVNDLLFVADFDNNRTLVYNIGDGITNGEAAINVLGQPDFVTSTAGNSASQCRGPLGLALDSTNNRLFISAFSGDKICVFDTATITNGESMIAALGTSATTASAHNTTAQNRIDNPSGLYYDATNERLFATSFNRSYVQIYDTSDGVTTSENAINVIGQANFTDTTEANTQAGLLDNTYSVHFDEVNNILYVLNGDARITMYLDSTDTIEFSGFAYLSDGVTPVADGSTINILQNGVSMGTTTTTAGAYSLVVDEADLAVSFILTAYIEGAASQGVTVTQYNNAAITDLDIYADTLIVRSETTEALDTSDLDDANTGAADIIAIYTDGSAPEIETGKTMLIPTGEEFDLTGTLSFSGSLTINGTLSGSGNLNFFGDFTNAGSISSDISIEMGGNTAQNIDVGAGDLASNLIISNTTADVTVTGNDLDLTGNFTLNSLATLVLDGFNLSVTGTFSNLGTVELIGTETFTLTQDITSGTFKYVGDNDASPDVINILDFGTTDYFSLVLNPTDGLDTFLAPTNLGIAGDFTNTSGFTHNSGIVSFTGDDQTITGDTTFATFSKTAANDGSTLTFVDGTDITINTDLSLTGADGDTLTLNSDSATPVSRPTVTMANASTFSGDYLDVTDNTIIDSSSAFTTPAAPTNSHNSGDTTDWFGIEITGTVYTDEGVTPLATESTVELLVNGVAAGSGTTTSGAFELYATVNVVADDILTLYINDEAQDGVLVTKYDSGDLSLMDIYQDHLVLNDTDDSITLANLNTANGGDTDITAIYADGATAVVASGKELYIAAGTTFAPGAALEINGDLEVVATATLDADAFAVNIAEDFINSGTFTHTAGNDLTFDGTTAQIFNPGSSAIGSNVIISNTAGVSFSTNALDIGTNDLTISASAILDLNGENLTADVLSNNGTLSLMGTETMALTTQDSNSGTFEYYGDGTASTFVIQDFGTNDYFNLVINDANATSATFELGADLAIGSSLTVTDGEFNADTHAMDINGSVSVGVAGAFTSTSGTLSVGSDFTNDGTFVHNLGTVVFDASVSHTLNGSTTFNNFTMLEASNNSTDATLTFEESATFGFEGTLTLDGLDASDRLILVSSEEGETVNFELDGALAALAVTNFLEIQDNTITNVNGSTASLPVSPTDSFNLGNTTGWFNASTQDSDGDGITDDDEGFEDADDDGLTNNLDTDSDGDGILDADEGNIDTDEDGTPDFLDTDSDDDGVPDADEGEGDTDGDGTANYLDTDSDGDLIPDGTDTDNDQDGIPDFLEERNSTDAFNPDEPYALGDSDDDANRVQFGLEEYLSDTFDFDDITTFSDHDEDGLPDVLEITLDSDLEDADEPSANGSDDDDDDRVTNALEEYLDDTYSIASVTTATDSDSDGIPDIQEVGFGLTADPTNADTPYASGDTDTDGDTVTDALEEFLDEVWVISSVDADSDFDGDGVTDVQEVSDNTDPTDADDFIAEPTSGGGGGGCQLSSGTNVFAPAYLLMLVLFWVSSKVRRSRKNV